MKNYLWICSLVILTIGCSKKEEPTTPFPERLSGFWIPYEIIDNSVPVENVRNFCGYSVFGAYDPGIEFYADGTFIPGNYCLDETGHGKKLLDEMEKGEFIYNAYAKTLTIQNQLGLSSYTIDKLTMDQMWLSSSDGRFKLKLRNTSKDD